VPQTTDEFLTVLRAFRDRDVGVPAAQKIPYVVEGVGNPRIDVFLGSWGVTPNLGYANMTIINDRVRFIPAMDEFREVLQFMNIMWRERLLDNALFTQTFDVSLSKFNSSVSGVFGLSSDDLWSRFADDYIPLPPPRQGNITPVIGLGPVHSGHAFVITRMDRSPEVSLRWIDWFYTEEGSRFIGSLSPMLEGVTAQRLPNGTWEYADWILNSPRGMAMAVGDTNPLPGGGFPYWRNEHNSNFIFSQNIRAKVPVHQPFYQRTPAFSYPVFSIRDAERINDIRRDIDVYVTESQARFITGELGFDRWNEFVTTLERLHYRELERFFQTAYDRMR
jgi:putative aldouronate transport system substrate-binding protein